MVRPRAELSASTHQAYGFAYDKTASGGRFTQVDPIGMSSVSLTSPQTLNLYAYCTNDPINHTDPSGLGFFSFLKKVFNVFNKILKWVAIAFVVALAVVAIVVSPAAAVGLLTKIGGLLIKLGIFKSTPMILNLAAGTVTGGGITLGITGGVLAGSGGVGAVVSLLQQDPPRKVITTDEHGRKVEVKPNEPGEVKREVRVPAKDIRGKIIETLRRNATRWERFKFTSALILKAAGKLFKDIATMVDPAVIAELACEENPYSQICRDFAIFLPPEIRCRLLRGCI